MTIRQHRTAILTFSLFSFGTLGFAGDPTPGPGMAQSPAEQMQRRLPRWLQLGAELRGRLEDPVGPGSEAGQTHPYYLHRFRLSARVKLNSSVSFFAEAQDSEALGYDKRPVAGTIIDTIDVRQLYAEYSPSEAPRWRVRVGRQPLVYGETRLIGSSNWGNVGPAWDAVNVAWGRPGARVEAFVASPVTPDAYHFDKPRRDTGLHGVYSVWEKLLPGGTVDLYLLWKRQDEAFCKLSGGLSSRTTGFRAVGRLPRSLRRFDYNVEAALQRGAAGRDRVRAWAGHFALGYQSAERAPKLVAAYDHASGDGDPSDGRQGTFDQLYPTYKWATADGFGWRNIRDPYVAIEWAPFRRWRGRAAGHRFWLADRRDSLYSQFNSVFVRGFDAGSGRIGDQIETRLEFLHSQHFRFGAGTARVFPGPYLREAGHRRAWQTMFVMWTATL